MKTDCDFLFYYHVYHVHYGENISSDVFIFVILRHFRVDHYKRLHVMFHRYRTFLSSALTPASPPVFDLPPLAFAGGFLSFYF